MDHSRAPVLEAVHRYRADGYLSFLPPGHKQGRGVDPRVAEVVGRDVFASDVILMNGIDDRAMSRGVLARAEDLMADAVGASRAFFSTCGSSLSVKSAMLSVAGPGEKLLLSRNAHKSVVAGVIISGVEPVWVHPRWDGRLHLAHPPGPDAVEANLELHPDAKGMLLITPTDYGTCGAIRETARLCHARGLPLIVDEAWGAHLPFHPDLPTWAMNAEADLCVTSVHKMGNGLEQGSVFHLQGDRVDPEVLAARADLLGTTSPSSLIFAGLDGWRRQMVEHGRELLDRAIELAKATRADLSAIPGIKVMERPDFVGPGLADDQDPLKIVLDLAELGRSGYDVNNWLRDEHRVDLGLSDHRRVTAQLTVADDEETASRLVAAIRSLAERADELPAAKPIDLPGPGELELEQALLPRDAFFGPTEDVEPGQAVGRIAAEMISPYPPGVPAVLPGERITRTVLDYLLSGLDAGMYVPDPADVRLRTLRVVAS
ncbi:aminotransferase class I/II-fold pyridoxal phosphate-dependent enzyme [Amycolatopsis sp. FDAARGOS 1241]|uniref:aminotransferase class I/II-fold pyridoxal phosphate-dependent enzyme n=1 Tax=Amycolatopsis sp. FDAARGOS 1241 TaxID=2778070 RepID=UPI00194E0B4F|nr:ornithine decarboxylase [Amycolatopsis sp. FDAARGOS 1241]QRP50868.1 ornithine decarboxylase [Amycolatopsis sp. FDAARGOS 1241]